MKDCKYLINEQIPNYKEVRITGNNINSKVVSLNDAKDIANELDLDVILINDKITPPIVKLGKYEKIIYELKKNNKKSKQTVTKEIQLSANIAEHDLEIKAKKAASFLEKGNKVKIILTLKGRELLRKDENQKSFYQMLVLLENVATVDSNIKNDGNKTTVILKKK